MLDFDQVVGAQGAAAADQVDDGIRQADQRRQLHRAVQLDQIDMHALGGEMLARALHVLGGHAQARAVAHRAGVVETGLHRHRHAALGDVQVDRLVQAFAAVLEQHILAGHAEVGRAVLHIGRHVGGAHDDHAHARVVGRQDQLARAFRIFGDRDAGRLQQRQGFLENAALGQGQRQLLLHYFTRSISAPTADSLASMRS